MKDNKSNKFQYRKVKTIRKDGGILEPEDELV
ncbi:MAG: hypothetical protein HeimC3_16140 [Candidatus Heimdallarchaeota archaeon LC_3]|nr:MAG: hypothetical protein HeimC3_16140 [Candidatus Heimdallarchaeota archaeon LC_3]